MMNHHFINSSSSHFISSICFLSYCAVSHIFKINITNFRKQLKLRHSFLFIDMFHFIFYFIIFSQHVKRYIYFEILYTLTLYKMANI
jgi:hypothetical protein